MTAIIFILILLAAPATAQELQFQQEQYPFPVTFYGVEPQLGFHSAGSYYHHDFGDLDNDGDFDLIIGSNANWEYYFENIGYIFYPAFDLITKQIVTPISEGATYQAPCFCDIDNDGDRDIFIGDKYGPIIFYENVGTPDSFIFVLSDSSFIDLSTAAPIMDFVDIDSDGDFDVFIGIGWTPYPGRIFFYRNTGTPESPIMNLESNYFEQINVGDNTSPEFCDIDADNDYDLFVGCEDGTVWYFENIGDSVSCDFQYITDNYYSIDVGNMSVPRFCDIDGDGDFDLFVANESTGNSVDFEGDISFYENIGNATNPEFQFVTGQYLFMDMSDRTSPIVYDIDNDGLDELMVGIGSGDVVMLENSGTQTEPEFYFADTSYFNLTFPYNPELSLGDLDDDGDMDLALSQGGFWSYVRTYRNIGSASSPVFEMWSEIEASWNYPIDGVDLVDIDGDGDLDLFYSYYENILKFWENIGNASSPRFQLISDNYLNQSNSVGESYPRFADLDHDNDFDLLIGRKRWNTGGYDHNLIEYWENIGDLFNPNFVPTDTIAEYSLTENISPRPCFSDIDTDGDLDIFCGEDGGGMLFFRNLENPYQAQLTITIQDNDIILKWGNITNAVEYQIFYQNIPYFTPSGVPQAIVIPPDTVWTDEGVLNAGKRWYRMVTEY